MEKFQNIAILTSGGDAPGMNAAVRAVVNAAKASGVNVIGLLRGYTGLMKENMTVDLTPRSVANIAKLGGTVLYSDRCEEFNSPEGVKKAVKACRDMHIDGVIAIGGDGTFRGATDLSNAGIPAIGIPGTIDNDITSTDYTIGFDTAMNTVLELADRFQDTCESHARCEVLEVMGRNAGDIALNTGIALGAVGVAIPELPFDADACVEKIKQMKREGQRSFTVVVAEGLGGDFGEALAKRIQDETTEEFGKVDRVETKFARLAHVVRGGNPTLRDRVTAAKMAEAAVNELLLGHSNLVVTEKAGEIVPVDINYALVLDRMYKNKLKDGDLKPFTAEQVKEMEAFCEAKRAELKKTYALVDIITK